MNKEQIIDESYKNYKIKTEIMMGHGFHGTLLSKEEFIFQIKTDKEFSETWGLKIEEREFSYEERAYGYNNLLEKQNYNPKWQSKIEDIDKLSEGELMTILQSLPGPTKLITITYKNEKIENYEN